VLTALGTDIFAEEQFGIAVSDLAYSACSFIVGTILAAVAVLVDSWHLPNEAATQSDRLSRHENLQAILNSPLTEQNMRECTDRMQAVHGLPCQSPPMEGFAVTTTIDDAKAMARPLRAAFEARGLAASHSDTLEFVAAQFGHRGPEHRLRGARQRRAGRTALQRVHSGAAQP